MENFSAISEIFTSSSNTIWHIFTLNSFVYFLLILDSSLSVFFIIPFSLRGVHYYYTTFLHFFFDTRGAKKKFAKRNAAKVISRSAEREEASAASTAPPFEKGGRKLLIHLTKLDSFVYNLKQEPIARGAIGSFLV